MKINDNCINHLSAAQAIEIDKTFGNRDTAEIQYSEVGHRYIVLDTIHWSFADINKLKSIVKEALEILITPLQENSKVQIASTKNARPKDTVGKLKLSLVPRGIVESIAKVREFGNKKYGDPNNWKKVSKQDYWEACLRHVEAARNNVDAVDPESGLLHITHLAANLSFILSGELK